MKKVLLTLVVIFSLFAFFAPQTFATLKKTQKIYVGAYKTAKDVRASFTNLKYAKKISYELTYQRAGGINDGAGGIIIPSKGKSVSKVLTLGSCSGKVCTYHKGIKNVKLKVTTWYSPSLTVETKTYTIK